MIRDCFKQLKTVEDSIKAKTPAENGDDVQVDDDEEDEARDDTDG